MFQQTWSVKRHMQSYIRIWGRLASLCNITCMSIYTDIPKNVHAHPTYAPSITCFGAKKTRRKLFGPHGLNAERLKRSTSNKLSCRNCECWICNRNLQIWMKIPIRLTTINDDVNSFWLLFECESSKGYVTWNSTITKMPFVSEQELKKVARHCAKLVLDVGEVNQPQSYLLQR